jgi:alpha-glucosidase (family GH31 glycosyl hydrolase)
MHWLLVLTILAYTIAAPVYELENVRQTNIGYVGDLNLKSGSGPYGGDVPNLKFEMTLETDTRIRVRITDRTKARWEVPDIVQTARPTSAPKNPKYTIDIKRAPFGFTVSRNPSKEIVFSTLGTPFVFEDQYITIGTTFPKADPNLYGVGERPAPLRLETEDSRYTIWNLDNLNNYKENSYGTHPFFMEFRNHTAYGVFLLNSNAQDVIIKNKPTPMLNFITIGGVIDLFIFLGPTPQEVISQYHEVIGRPFMPPFWGLGWHQSRYGYQDLNEIKTVARKYRENNLPLDTMWSDIDYMQNFRDFTWDSQKYPVDQVKAFAEELHRNKQQYMVIIDPGLHAEPGYPPYDIGIQKKLFIKKADNSTPIVNKVWPGLCVFPDFTNTETYAFWESLLEQFLGGVPIDGIWLDMNEIACFCEGECDSQSEPKQTVGFNPMNPPYVPGSQYNRTLSARTLRMDAVTALGKFYDVHSLYVHYELDATVKALQKIRKKRAMILTRASFAGTGSKVAHWTGDNHSTFFDLKMSISQILSMQLYGVPMIGADICGFFGNATFELCARWTQLGSLYPWSRNHNCPGQTPQEPYAYGGEFTVMARNVLLNRYSLLLYMYTQYHHASVGAGTVWRPLFVEFPDDDEKLTASNDVQFMLGHGLLGTPVVTEGATQVSAYFPGTDGWFDYYTGEFVSKGREVKLLQAAWDHINIHVRGGSIVVKQKPELTSAETRVNPITLLVALDAKLGAHGDLYLDDGDSLDTFAKGQYTYIEFVSKPLARGFNINNSIVKSGYIDAGKLRVEQVLVYGAPVADNCTYAAQQAGKTVPVKVLGNNVLQVLVDVNLVDPLNLSILCK